MKKPLHRWPSALLRPNTGFTLVELAVATAAGALLIMITMTVLSALLSTHKRLGGLSRLQERWSRVKFLIDTEIQEAQSVENISNGFRLIICEPQSDLSAPDSDGVPCSDGSPGTDGKIDYVWDVGKQALNRNGPGIDCRGELRLGRQGEDCSGLPISDDSDTSMVSTGVIAFSPVVTNQSVTYSMSFRDPLDPNGSIYKKESSAGAQSIK